MDVSNSIVTNAWNVHACMHTQKKIQVSLERSEVDYWCEKRCVGVFRLDLKELRVGDCWREGEFVPLWPIQLKIYMNTAHWNICIYFWMVQGQNPKPKVGGIGDRSDKLKTLSARVRQTESCPLAHVNCSCLLTCQGCVSEECWRNACLCRYFNNIWCECSEMTVVLVRQASLKRPRHSKHTLSRRFFQASSRCDMRSIQCERVAIMPAVVALKVKASPLKSTEWPPCCDNTDSVTSIIYIENTDWHTQYVQYATTLMKMIWKSTCTSVFSNPSRPIVLQPTHWLLDQGTNCSIY